MGKCCRTRSAYWAYGIFHGEYGLRGRGGASHALRDRVIDRLVCWLNLAFC